MISMWSVFTLDTLIIAALLTTLIYKPARNYFVFAKIAASTAFLGIAVLFWQKSGKNAWFFHILPGFLLCFLGDVCLGIYNVRRKKTFFLAGLFLFLLGHLSFLAALVTLQPLGILDVVVPMLAVLGTMGITIRKQLLLGKMKPYVYLYSFFVAMFFVKSMHIFGRMPQKMTACLALGSCLFLISDFLILFLYFAKRRPWSTHGWNLATYYYGMFFLALSILT